MRAIVFITGLLICQSAFAHPAGVSEDSELGHWFAEQHSVKGQHCCGFADAFYLGDDEWKIDNKTGLYQVKIGDQWIDVPTDAMRDTVRGGDNPTNQAIVWYRTYTTGITIFCFCPSTFY